MERHPFLVVGVETVPGEVEYQAGAGEFQAVAVIETVQQPARLGHRTLTEEAVTPGAGKVLVQQCAQRHVLQRTVGTASDRVEPLGKDPLGIPGLADDVLELALIGAETAACVALDLQQSAHDGAPLGVEVKEGEIGALEADLGVPCRRPATLLRIQLGVGVEGDEDLVTQCVAGTEVTAGEGQTENLGPMVLTERGEFEHQAAGQFP